MARTIGKLWIKNAKQIDGKPTYYTGFIEMLPNQLLQIAVVPNDRKAEDKQNDYNIIVRKAKSEVKKLLVEEDK